jgi:hypothetical protein
VVKLLLKLKRRLADWLVRFHKVRKLYGTHFRESDARAERLLRSWLSPAQLKQFDAERYFDVIGCDSGKRYRIHWGRTSNTYEIDDAGEPRTGWCFAPAGNLPPGDVVLAQKIALETFERRALALANRFLPKNFSSANRRST